MAISTHVLDATTGRPAAGLGLALSRRDDDGWRFLDHRETGPDGRVTRLAVDEPDDYRIVFHTDPYHPHGFHPDVPVALPVADPAGHYHVPLLLSPFSYSTYRGS